MNRQIIKDELQWLVEAISEQAAVLQSYTGRIPQIELDMLMENVRKFYENLHLLNRINDAYDSLERSSAMPFPRPASKSETVTDLPPVNKEPEKKEVELPAVTIHYGSVEEKKEEVHTASADLFPEEEFDFAGKLKEAREKALGPLHGKEKPAGLKSAISINDKFLFINELFDGNLKDYNENIEALGAFPDLKSAFDFLDLLRLKNRWESDGKGFKRMREILESVF